MDFVIFSIELYACSTWWSAYPEWGKCTLINVIRCLFTVIDESIATPCLFSNFPAPMSMCPCRDSHISALFGLHVSESKRASLEFSDLVFFCSTTKVTFFHHPSHVANVFLWCCCCLRQWLRSRFSLPSFASFLLPSTFSGSLITTSLLRMHSGTSPSMKLSPCHAGLGRVFFFRDYS